MELVYFLLSVDLGKTMNNVLISLILAGGLFSSNIASAEVWILWEESDGATPYLEPSATHGFASRGQCIAAANTLMGVIAKREGYELAMDPFDHETVMGKRGEEPNPEYKYALCYPSNFDPRERSPSRP